MPILASCSTIEDRSTILPSMRNASAALARPGPIDAAISAPLTGFSNDRTDPSGKKTFIMATTAWENSEHASPADTLCRQRRAGKRHKCARPAESSSDGGGVWSGEKPAFHEAGDSCGGPLSQAGGLLPGGAPTVGNRRPVALIGAGECGPASCLQPEMTF